MSDTKQPEQKPSRRKFLAAAVTGSVGAAAAGFPMIAKAQAGPISMRWQSTWPAKDIFHEYAQDFAKKVNDMTGGDLKIEALKQGRIAGAGIDVFEGEPKFNPGFLELENVALSPHIGSSSAATRMAMAMRAADNLIAALGGERPPNLLNPEALQ